MAYDRASGLEELAKATALMKFRDTVEARIAAWIGDDELNNDDENEDDNQEEAETKDLSKDEDEEEEEEEEQENDEDKLAKSEPKLETDLQKMQVRMLLNMMRVTKHSDVSCGDDYRGNPSHLAFSNATDQYALVNSSLTSGTYPVAPLRVGHL
jgi:cobalamin biosynthesis protein CobT